jgi:hypothetical protein
MKNERAIIDYSRLSSANLKLTAENVVNCLTDNPNFPTTMPTLEAFTELVTAFSVALDKSLSGDKVLIALKNQAKVNLLTGLRTLSTSINVIAYGNRAMLLSSGLLLAGQGEAQTSILPPTDVKLWDTGNPGEMWASCKKVRGAINYSFEYATEVPTSTTRWHAEVDSSREHLFKNLPSGTRIYVRIRAFGHRGLQSISEVVSRMVQ